MSAAAQTALDEASQQEAPAQEIKLSTDPSNVTQQERNPQKIARLAYSYWEARGCPNGSAEEDWFRAERELYSDSSVTES